MKGVIFNLLEEVVVTAAGVDAWEDVVDATGVDAAYTAIGNYPDAELTLLLRSLPDSVVPAGVDPLRWFGRRAMPLLGARYPVFFAGHEKARGFLFTLNEIIHPEVRRLYPGIDVPVFDFSADPGHPERALFSYRSVRRLCRLAEGFVEGAADHFGERVAIVQQQCLLDGADRCVFDCAFTPLGARPAPVHV